MDSNEQSLKLLEENEVVCFARFEYKECRTKIPYLKKLENGYMAVYPHLSAYPKENEALIMKVNQMILSHCGVDIVENRIVYLNKEYVRQDALDLNELLCISDKLFNKRNHLSKTIAECMEEVDVDLDGWIERTKEILNRPSVTPVRTKQCTALRRCNYYSVCFNESNEPDDSILFFTTNQHKLDAYDRGIRHIHELPLNQIEGFRLQYAQYMASKTQKPFMDRAALQVWMKQIKYPISYLDFEWDTFAVPPYMNMKPFDVLCFQYSLHVETSDGNLTHYNFFESKDCRRHFIEQLIKDLPKTGTILVYNMEGAEKLRLKQLASQFEEYKEELDAIYIASTEQIEPLNKVKTNSLEPKELDKYLKTLKAEQKELKGKLDEELDIFGGLEEDIRKIKKLANKTHRENPKNKFLILGLTKQYKVVDYKVNLSQSIWRINEALSKMTTSQEIIAYMWTEDGVTIDANKINIFNLDAEDEIKKAIEKSEDNKINLYKIKLDKGSNVIAFSNCIYYDNQNKTLPVGMDNDTRIIAKLSDMNIELDSKKVIKVGKLDDEEMGTKLIVKNINILEYTVKQMEEE